MRPRLTDLHGYHVREESAERLMTLIRELPEQHRKSLDDAVVEYEMASWDLYSQLRRNGYKADRARNIATGTGDR